MGSKERPRADRTPLRSNFDRVCLNNLDLSSLGAAATAGDEEKIDNSSERINEQQFHSSDEAAIAAALLNRMNRLMNTHPRSAREATSRSLPVSNRNGSFTASDRSPGAPSRVNNFAAAGPLMLPEHGGGGGGGSCAPDRLGVSLANNLRTRSASGSTGGTSGPSDLASHQMRNDLRSANALASEFGNGAAAATVATCAAGAASTAAAAVCAQDSRLSGMNRIVSQLMQIRESIQQANASITDISEQDASQETRRHLANMQVLIQKLRQQEEAYIQLLSQMVDEDRANRELGAAAAGEHGGRSGAVVRSNRDPEARQEDLESIDVPMELDPPSDGEHTGGSSSGVAEATQSDTAYVEDAYAELEQLRCQRDMLREILSQHEELRALQGLSEVSRFARANQQEDADASGAMDDRDEDEDDENEEEEEEEEEEEDDEEEEEEESRDRSLVRRNGDDGGRGEEAAGSSMGSDAEDGANGGVENDAEYLRLSQSKEELSVRLRDLQSKKDHLDSLLLQLQSLRDMRGSHLSEELPEQLLREPGGGVVARRRPQEPQEAGEDLESTSSSLAQLGGALQLGQHAGDTALEAEETLRLLDAQKKLMKLKQVRERLDRIRSMMTYYQDATAFIHSGDEESAEAGAAEAGLNPPRSARQRLLEYGSGSESGSQAEGSAVPWREQPSGRSAASGESRQLVAASFLPGGGGGGDGGGGGGGGVGGGRSGVSSDSGSLNSEQLWEQHPQLVARIRQLNSAKTRLNRLQTLIQAMEAGAALSDLPEELREMAVELLGEEEGGGLPVVAAAVAAAAGGQASGQRALPPPLSRSNGRAEVEEEDEDDPEALLSSYKNAVAEQKRELSQLMEERDKLLSLQRQMEQLHSALPTTSAAAWPAAAGSSSAREAPAGASAPPSATAVASSPPAASAASRRAPSKLAKKDAGSLALRSLRLRPPSSAAAAAASMEALTAALQQRTCGGSGPSGQRDSSVTTETSEAAEAVSTASSAQAPPPGRTSASMTGRRSETVTFQEPVATFVANDEVYENICAQRIMREELRQKKREIAAIMKKDSASGAYRRNQGGSTGGTDNQSLDTALGTLLSTDMTTAATWGDGSVLSNADGDADEGDAAGGGVEEEEEEEEEGANVASGPSFPAGLEAAARHMRLQQHSHSPAGSVLGAQVGSTLELCRTLLEEQRKLTSLIQTRSPGHSGEDAFQLPSPVAMAAPAWQQMYAPMLYSSVNFCCQCLVQLQGDVLKLQQQVGTLSSKPPAGPKRGRGPQATAAAAKAPAVPVPPLDLSSVKERARRREAAARAERSAKEPRRPRPRPGDYRPGVSAGISGTGYAESIDADDLSLASVCTEELASAVGLHLPRPRGPAPWMQQQQRAAAQKQLKQHDLGGPQRRLQARGGPGDRLGPAGDADVGLFEALRETIYAEVATLISQNEARPNYLIDLFRELQLLSTDYLRQRVLYAIQDLVNKSLVRQYCRDGKPQAPRPGWLRAGYDESGQAEEQTPSESLVTTDEDVGPADERGHQTKLYDATLRKLEAQTNWLFNQRPDESKPAGERSTELKNLLGLREQMAADYAEEVESVSSMSTPQASPFAADSLGDTVIHLDKTTPSPSISSPSQTMQLLREMERRGQTSGERLEALGLTGRRGPEVCGGAVGGKEEDEEKESEDSDSDDDGCPNVDPQQLNEEIRGVIHFLVPMLKEVSPQTCSGSLLSWIRELIMRRIRVVIARLHGDASAATANSNGEFDRFFDKQLNGLLQDTLRRYEGKLLAECIEDLMVDVSELLFNELAFFKLIADLEKAPEAGEARGAVLAASAKVATESARAAVDSQEAKTARLEAVAAVVALAMQGDEEELDNKRDDQMANEMACASPASRENEDRNQRARETDSKQHDQEEDEEEEEEEEEEKEQDEAEAEAGYLSDFEGDGAEEVEEEEDEGEEEEEEEEEEGEGLQSSVRAVLAQSETKPMTRIGSDEDDEEETDDGDSRNRTDCDDTAVSYVDAEEKDAMMEGATEKGGKQAEDSTKQLSEPVASVANGDLTLDDLPAHFNLNSASQPDSLAALLPSGEAELAGDPDACPPPPTAPSADTRSLGQ